MVNHPTPRFFVRACTTCFQDLHPKKCASMTSDNRFAGLAAIVQAIVFLAASTYSPEGSTKRGRSHSLRGTAHVQGVHHGTLQGVHHGTLLAQFSVSEEETNRDTEHAEMLLTGMASGRRQPEGSDGVSPGGDDVYNIRFLGLAQGGRSLVRGAYSDFERDTHASFRRASDLSLKKHGFVVADDDVYDDDFDQHGLGGGQRRQDSGKTAAYGQTILFDHSETQVYWSSPFAWLCAITDKRDTDPESCRAKTKVRVERAFSQHICTQKDALKHNHTLWLSHMQNFIDINGHTNHTRVCHHQPDWHRGTH